MADGIILNKQEYDRFRRMLFEYERNRGGRVQVRRRRGIMGGGGSELITANVVRDPKYNDPDRVYPTDCTWGTPDDPWPLENQDYYIVRLESDTTAVYDPGSAYIDDDYCLFEVLADSVTDEDFAEIGYGYLLKYKCTGNTGGLFDYTKWEAVNLFADGQWGILFPVGESSAVDMRDYLPWFDLDDLLAIIEIDGDYLFWQTFIYVGEGGVCSLAWKPGEGEEKGRAMAVYK